MTQTDEGFTLSKEELMRIAQCEVTKKYTALRDWLRVIVTVTIPLIVVISMFNHTAFQVEQNTKDLTKQEAWIESHVKDMNAIKDSVASISQQQAVVLEKITAIQAGIVKNK